MSDERPIGQIAAALAKFQGEVTNPAKSREVKVSGQGGSYSFKYAELSEILDCCRPILAKHGLSVTHLITMGATNLIVKAKLLHSSGEWLESELSVVKPDKIQQVGSAITYMRRYSLSALIGIADMDDDDGNTSDGNRVDDTKKVRASQSKFSGPPAGAKAPEPKPTPAPADDSAWLLEVDGWVSPVSHDEFKARFSACFTKADAMKAAGNAEPRAQLLELGSDHGFSFRSGQKQPLYTEVNLGDLSVALKMAESIVGVFQHA